MKTKLFLITLLLSFFAKNVLAQEPPVEQELLLPPDPDFIPYEEKSPSESGIRSNQPFMSCLDYINSQRYLSGKDVLDHPQLVKKMAFDQTKTGAYIGSGVSLASGVAAGVLTGNPVIGLGVYGVMGAFNAIDTEMEKSKIKKSGNLITALDKVLLGQSDMMSKKERRIFNKSRKKVERRVEKNIRKQTGMKRYDYNLSDTNYASTVQGQSNIYNEFGNPSENLFCDIDKKGRVVIKPYDKSSVKKLALAQSCKEGIGMRGKSIASSSKPKRNITVRGYLNYNKQTVYSR